MLLFELFPAFVALVAMIVGLRLFAINRRARNDPIDQELPRTPSQPPVSPEAATARPADGSRRPSMRA